MSMRENLSDFVGVALSERLYRRLNGYSQVNVERQPSQRERVNLQSPELGETAALCRFASARFSGAGRGDYADAHFLGRGRADG